LDSAVPAAKIESSTVVHVEDADEDDDEHEEEEEDAAEHKRMGFPNSAIHAMMHQGVFVLSPVSFL
jgi:hypothetical protein